MNWRGDEQDTSSPNQDRNFFVPESLLTEDGWRVMWAWFTTLENNVLRSKTVQSLPSELSLRKDGTLRIEPLCDLKGRSFDLETFESLKFVAKRQTTDGEAATFVTDLKGDAREIRIMIDRKETGRIRFDFRLFPGEKRIGVPIYFQPNNHTIRLGDTETPFAISD